uniref:Nidogen 2a (osteonidogen) n=1 Tax=Esox lucius TaxID=8010 RepID=A0A3P9A7G2_ESOLU
MARGILTIFLLQLSWTVHLVTAIQRKDIFPYGTPNGDFILQNGDDETSKVLALKRPLYFYEAQFNELYVATNGIISAQDLPMEKQYVDDGFPTDFPVIAPFLSDIDTSKGKGAIYYRVTESPTLLNRVAHEVHRGFPDARFTPTHAIIATWENVAAYEEIARDAGQSDRLNTFQAVVAYDENNSYAIFLYPEDGLQFFGTRPKESYNVEIELPARVGFSRGEVAFLIFSRVEGPYYSVTNNEQSLKNLYQVGNTGVPGVWLFHIGSRYSFQNVVPASTGGALATPPPRGLETYESTTAEYPEAEYTAPFEEEEELEEGDYSPITDPDFHSPAIPEFHVNSHPDRGALPGHARLQPYGGDLPLTSNPQYRDHDNIDTPTLVSGPSGPAEYPDREVQPQAEAPQAVPRPEHTALEVFPYTREENSPRLESSPPLAPGGGHIVDVVEEENFETGETKRTCAVFQQQCSQNAYCTDYPAGFCCHCRTGFYGNGWQCLPDGAPHRVNGKVSGTVIVGSTPVYLNSVDLHAYIVVSDGRAYTAISEVPENVGWALMPVAPIGEIFGWLFAMELPSGQAGFKITGAEFTRHAEVTFYPGNQKLTIVQTAQGLNSDNYMTVDTRLHGNVPFIAAGSTVQVEPYKDTYQYYPSVVTSASVREFTVVSAERGSETFTFQLRQNITYRDCHHGPRTGPETLQLTTERVFVMYVRDENILRYAITNKISSVGEETSEPVLVNPCYAGTHDCDTTAQCLPGEGQQYLCQCATGYRGDGRNCYGEGYKENLTRENGLSQCGPHTQCVNLPGTHSCHCQAGYEFGFDGRTCLDIDECRSQPCHPQATCTNTLGSFQCQCQPTFQGDGFQCFPSDGETDCEHHRDSVQTTSPEGYPIVGAFVPQCDEHGQYRDLQCHGSTGHCWCVDNRGQERAGTRKAPGAGQPNCNEPEVLPPTQRPDTVCERWRASLVDHYGGKPEPQHYLPQCDREGQFNPVQCYGDSSYCWCVDRDGREVAGTRSHDVVKPACIPTVAPPTMHPLPRPDMTPPPSGTFLLYAQGQQIGALPLKGTHMDLERSSTLLALHGSIVVGIDYDCREGKVYWTDLAGRTINRAKMEPGAEPETLINTGLTSPEGLAVDVQRRAMFWVDSTPDKIERANLDGSGRKTIFDTDLVNPRAIIVDSSTGTLYWTDWNREAPKIESSSVDGHNRKVLVKDGIGLPNALTFDTVMRHVCWADAGTKRLECIASDGTGRRVIHSNLNYPFSMVFYSNHFYFTDWRRDGVIALNRDNSQFTDEYIPDQRSHLYGVTVATTHCL